MNNNELEDLYLELDEQLGQFFHGDANEAEEQFLYPIQFNLGVDSFRYECGDIVGIGGMKRVIRTIDKMTGRPVAMAVLNEAGDREQIEQFLREARITAALEHPNIMPVYDMGLSEEKQPFFTMQLIGGDNLGTIIKELQKHNPHYVSHYSLSELLDIFVKVCDAVAYAHSKNVIHLDLKPENIQVGEFGEVLLCDWGLSKVLHSGEKEEWSTEELDFSQLDSTILSSVTRKGIIKGTPGYMAPEQIYSKFGFKGKHTDIYALGGLLYSIMTLKAPVRGGQLSEVIDATVNGRIPAPKDVAGGREVPASLEAVAMKALQLKVENRYGAAMDIIYDIQSYQRGFATEAEEAGFLISLFLLYKRHKASTLFTLSIFALVGFFLWRLTVSEHNRFEEEKKKLEVAQEKELIANKAIPTFVKKMNGYINSGRYEQAAEYAELILGEEHLNIKARKVLVALKIIRQEFDDAGRLLQQLETPDPFLVQVCRKYGAIKRGKERLPVEQFLQLYAEQLKYKRIQLSSGMHRFAVMNYPEYQQISIIRGMLILRNSGVRNLKFRYWKEGGRRCLSLAGNAKLKTVSPLVGFRLDYLDVSGTAVASLNFLKNTLISELVFTDGPELKFRHGGVKAPKLKKVTVSRGMLKKGDRKKLRGVTIVEK